MKTLNINKSECGESIWYMTEYGDIIDADEVNECLGHNIAVPFKVIAEGLACTTMDQWRASIARRARKMAGIIAYQGGQHLIY